MILCNRSKSKIIALFILISAFSCGRASNQNSQHHYVSNSNSQINYEDWCLRNQLRCPSKRPDQSYPAKDTVSASLLLGGNLIKRQETEWRISSEAWSDARLKEVFNNLELGDTYNLLDQFFIKQELSEILTLNESIVANLNSPTKLQASSGLQWIPSPKVLSQAQPAHLFFNGISLSDSNGNNWQSFHSIKYSGEGDFEIETSENQIVGIPFSFFRDEFGLEKLPTFIQINIFQGFSAIVKLLPWLFDSNLTVDLKREFFAETSNELSNIGLEKEIKVLLPLLANAAEFSISPEKDKLIQLKFLEDKEMNCEFKSKGAPKVVLRLDNQVLVKKISQNQLEKAVQISFSGIEAKIEIPGPIKPKLKIKELTIDKDHITLKNIPIIGQIKVPHSEKSDSNVNIKCY